MSRGEKAADPTEFDDPQVRAGGGLVWRGIGAGAGAGANVELSAVQILVVHRPRYDDWTLPKGKCDPGESYRDCALREVEEETGFVCELGDELPDVRYVDHKGRTKRVRYWVMQVNGGEFAANDEVDDVEWLPAADVAQRLSYRHDIPVVEAFLAKLPEGEVG